MPSTSPATLADPSHLRGFFQFVLLRQVAWYNRHILGKPEPWTDDPTLRRARFTNVYRFLDRGTQFLVETILEPGVRKLLTRGDEVRYLQPVAFEDMLMYRYLNNIESWRAVREDCRKQKWDKVARIFYTMRERGETLVTPAYISTYCPPHVPGDFIASLVEQLKLLKDAAAPLYAEVMKLREGQEAFNRLLGLYGVGPFMAYQFLGDLRTPLRGLRGPVLACNTWDWCHLGGGGIAGLRLIFPHADKKNGVELARFLRDAQVTQFRRLEEDGLTAFPYVTDLSQPEPEPVTLTLHDIEHSLCEYQKYVRGSAGGHVKGTLAVKRPGDDWRPQFPTIPAYAHRSYTP